MSDTWPTCPHCGVPVSIERKISIEEFRSRNHDGTYEMKCPKCGLIEHVTVTVRTPAKELR